MVVSRSNILVGLRKTDPEMISFKVTHTDEVYADEMIREDLKIIKLFPVRKSLRCGLASR